MFVWALEFIELFLKWREGVEVKLNWNAVELRQLIASSVNGYLFTTPLRTETTSVIFNLKICKIYFTLLFIEVAFI